MLNNILFLSKGLQLGLLLIGVCLLLMLSRIAAINEELVALRRKQSECVDHDEFMEFFRSMWLEMSSGGDVT